MKKINEILDPITKEAAEIVSVDLPEIIKFTAEHKITDDESYQKAIDFAVKIKEAEKFYKSEAKKYLEPFKDVVKKLKAGFDAKSKVVSDASYKMTAAIGDYSRKLREEQEAAARKARQEEEERIRIETARAKEVAELFGDAKSQHELKKITKEAEILECTSEPVVYKPKIQRSSTGGSISVRKNWKFEVTDMALLAKSRPDLIIINEDSKAINSLIKGEDGVREIEGLRIYCEETSVIRT